MDELAHEEIDFRQLGEDSGELIIAFDSEFRYTYVNPQVEKLVNTPRKDLLGRTIWEVAPHTEGTIYAEKYRQAMRERIVLEFEAYYPPLDRWNRVRCVPESNGGLIVFARNTTEEHNVERARREADERFSAAEAQMRRAVRVLDSVNEAYVTLDRDFRVIYANAEAGRINQKPVEAFVGKLQWEEWPASKGTPFEFELHRAMTERVIVNFRERYHVPGVYDVWMDVKAYPADEENGGGLHLVYRDVTESVLREKREKFFTDFLGRIQNLTDPDRLITDTLSSVAEFLNVSRCTYADIDMEVDRVTVHTDYCTRGMKSIAGILSFSAFGEYLVREFKAGCAVAVADVRNDPLRVPAENIPAYLEINVLAHITVPVVHSERLVSTIAVHSETPREWKAWEVELLRKIVERLWLSLEVRRQRDVARTELAERRRAEHGLKQSLNLLNAVVDGIAETGDMVIAIDRQHRFLHANRAALRFLGATSEMPLLGKTGGEWFGGDKLEHDTREEEWHSNEAVMLTGEVRTVEFESKTIITDAKSGLRTYISSKAPLRDSDTGEIIGLVNIIHDISERKRAEQRLRRLFDSEVVGVIFWNLETSLITDANDTFLKMVGYTRDDLNAGRLNFREMTPPEWTDRNEEGVSNLLGWGYAPAYEKEYYRKDGSRVPIFIGGTRFDDSAVEGYSYILDITERRQVLERERFIARLSEQTREFLDPDKIIRLTGESVAEFLKLVRLQYIEVEDHLSNRELNFSSNSQWTWRSNPGTEPGILSPVLWGDLAQFAELRSGRTVAFGQVTADPQTTTVYPALPVSDGIGAIVHVPILRDSRLLGIFSAEAKILRIEEVLLIQTVVQRMVLGLENAHLYYEMQQEVEVRRNAEEALAEAYSRERARADKEAVLARIGAATRASLPPGEVQSIAIEALGRALGAHRCYFATIDTPGDAVLIENDYRSDTVLASLSGEYTLSEFGIEIDTLFNGGQALIVPDTQNFPVVFWGIQTITRVAQMGIRAIINVPFYNEYSKIIGVLAVAMAGTPRQYPMRWHWSRRWRQKR